MERWRALVALNVAGKRVEPGEIFEGQVENLADAVRLRLAEPAPPPEPAKAKRKPRR